jgi:hypothetical protein
MLSMNMKANKANRHFINKERVWYV